MRKFLIFLSGGRPDVLDLVPAERPAFVLRGLAVLVTSILFAWGVAWSLVQAFDIGFAPAVAVGCVAWLVEIFVQRLPIIPSASRRRRLAFLLPSVCISLVLASLLVPLLLISVFRADIAYQLTDMQARAADAFQVQQASSGLAAQATELQSQVTALRKVIATGGGATLDPAADPTLTTLQKELKTAQTAEATAYARWQCQLFGTDGNGASCLAGNGPAAEAAQATYNNDRATVTNLQSQVNTRKEQLQSDSSSARKARLDTAKEQLPAAQATLSKDEHELNLQRSQFDAANNQNTGLLARLVALNDLADSDIIVRLAMLFGYVFFVLLASSPGLLVLLQTSAGYESALAATERQEALRLHYQFRVREEVDMRLAEALYKAVDRPGGPVIPPLPPEASPGEMLDRALRRMPDMRYAGYPDDAQAAVGDNPDDLL